MITFVARKCTWTFRLSYCTIKGTDSSQSVRPFVSLSDTEKIELIALLSSSMTTAKQPASNKKGWASRFAGTWKDSRSAEEIVRDIRSTRTTNTFDVELNTHRS